MYNITVAYKDSYCIEGVILLQVRGFVRVP